MHIVLLKDEPDYAREQALQALRRGEVIIFPTDTVYGIGGDATLPQVRDRVQEFKNRPPQKPFPWLVAGEEMAKEFVAFSPEAHALAKDAWPGGTTLVLPRRNNPKETLGVRAPGHAWLRELIVRFGKPIIGTSANKSGQPPATTASSAAEAFPKVALIFDGGVCDGKPSKVIDMTGTTPQVLRE